MPDFASFFSLPLKDPVQIFAAALMVFLVVPLLFERLRMPGILGLVLTGAVIGPNGLGVLERDSTFELLGRVGLLYIFFTAALEVDLKEFVQNRRNSMVFGVLSFLVPQVLGAVAAVYILDFSWVTAILLGSMFGSHTLLAYPVASKLGITRSRIVTTGVGGTIITDSLAIMVLAVIAASQTGDVGPTFWLVFIPSIVLYVGLIFTAVPILARWFFRQARAGGIAEFVFLMTTVYCCAALAPLARLEPIIGAFLAGFALNRFVPHSGPLMNRVDFLGHSLFIPFFLVATGMLVDVRVLISNPAAIGVAVFMVVGVTVTKFLAAFATQRLFSYTREEMMVLFGLSVPQAAATLAAVFVGREIGLFDDAVLNGAIAMILVTCLVGPLAIQRYGPAVAIAQAEQADVSTGETQRILVPLANPQTAGELVGVALMLRRKADNEPLLPMCVVPDEAQVMRSERLLVEAVVSASEADVKTEPLTRIDRNPSSGILRAAQEKRTTDIIIGWNGERSAGRAIFGSVIDQVVEHSSQQVVVVKLLHPVATSKRVVMTLPTSIVYHPGFYYAMQSIKLLCSQLGVSLHVIAVRTDLANITKALKRAGLTLPFSSEELPDWSEVEGRLKELVTEDDLAVLISSRRNAVGHSRAMNRLPGTLAALDLSFMVLYPSSTSGAIATIGAGLPDFLSPQNIIFNPAEETYPEIIRQLVATEFTEGSNRWKNTVEALLQDEFAIALLRDSRIILSHTRVRGINEAKLLLALRPAGIRHPQSEVSTHVVAVVLFPSDYTAQKHLAMLAHTAQFFSNKAHVEALRNVTGMEEFIAWLNVKLDDEAEDEEEKEPPAATES